MKLISPQFFIFLSTSLLLYRLTPKSKRWILLCIISLFFYAFAGIFAFLYIFVVALSSYFFALLMQRCDKGESKSVSCRRKRYIFIFSVIRVLSAWMAVKIFCEVSGGLIPLGISFYSLRIISYLVDVKRGHVSAETDFLKYLLYVSYFPMIIQGPLFGYKDMRNELYSGECADTELFLSGVLRFLWGIFKKIVVANALTAPLSEIYDFPNSYSGAYTLFLLIFYSAQIYCDFSGGIDMAIGVSRMFGISLPENFDRPFSSTTPGEFWNRWHITLSGWFEHYVFYPISLSKPMQKISRSSRKKMGSNIGKRIPLYIATLFTWLMTGLWHGVKEHYISWGLINGVMVLISSELQYMFSGMRKNADISSLWMSILNIFRRVRVFLLIGAVRLLDVYRSTQLTLRMLSTIFFDGESYISFFGGGVFGVIEPYALVTVLFALAVIFFVSKGRISTEKIARHPWLSSVTACSLIFACLMFGSYGVGFNADDFIYSQF